ncbi:unnamed protein product, partial [Cylicocyclus nassatus]
VNCLRLRYHGKSSLSCSGLRQHRSQTTIYTVDAKKCLCTYGFQTNQLLTFHDWPTLSLKDAVQKLSLSNYPSSRNGAGVDARYLCNNAMPSCYTYL